MSRFVDTSFNRDCPHHTHYISGNRCPYCFAERKDAVRERWARIGARVAWVAAVAWLVWLSRRGH